jgi:peroxiredoxin
MKYLILFCLLISISAIAQNQPLKNIATGETVSIRDFKGAKAVVVIFTSNVCAFDGYYADRIKSLISSYSANVQFILVNSYLEAEEAEDKMKAKYDSWGFNVPYLADKNQDWMKAFGAKKSPEVFVLNPNSDVIYSGAIDDNPQLAGGVKEFYLKKVLDGVKVASTRTTGCSIRTK